MLYKSLSSIYLDDIFLQLDNFAEGIEVIAKLESFNPANSIKLKAATAMLDVLELERKLLPGGKIIESSSGNLGVALAMLCAERKYKFICISDYNASPQNVALMKAYGAEVHIATPSEGMTFVQARLKIISQLQAQEPDLIWTDQYSNINNPRIHYETTAPEILRQVPDLDYLFIGVGSCGTFMGCSQYFREYSPNTKIIAVDPVGSILFGNEIQKRYLPGIGGAIKPKILDSSLADDFVTVSETDALKMCHEISKERGWLIGGSTGSALQGIKLYQHKIPTGSKVMLIAPDSGVNYISSIYNDEWLDRVYPHLCEHKILKLVENS